MTDIGYYQKLVQESHRVVMRKILQRVANLGLEGDQHFFISFPPLFPGVVVPEHLLEQYPDEITIVLQHEFWDLHVEEPFFSVILCFDNVNEKIQVPYNAITHFSDPSVHFELACDIDVDHVKELEELLRSITVKTTDPHLEPKNETAKVISLDTFRKK